MSTVILITTNPDMPNATNVIAEPEARAAATVALSNRCGYEQPHKIEYAGRFTDPDLAIQTLREAFAPRMGTDRSMLLIGVKASQPLAILRLIESEDVTDRISGEYARLAGLAG